MKNPWVPSQARSLPWPSGVTYGLLGLPLAFAALPLYVVLPHFYASNFGLSLATVGGLLLAVRMVDAIAEPWIGRFSDALFARSVRNVLQMGGLAALVVMVGMTGLFFPLVQGSSALAAWMMGGLLVTCVAHSLVLISHQAWGIRLGGDELLRSRIVAWREGFGMVGVIAASALSIIWGPKVMLVAFGGMLFLGLMAWSRAPRPQKEDTTDHPAKTSLWQPLAEPGFRRLLAVFMCNGIASAVPAALMLFFAQDRLQASEQATTLFLVLYFVCGAASLPLWLRAVRAIGLARSWLAGMLLAVACFAWTAGLGTGQVEVFAVICALTGVALGADLAMPAAMLACLIGQQGGQGRNDGAYLGWWNLATKLNLALAAGAVLPLLQWGGYVPGSQDPLALQRLSWTYALVPCLLKLVAALLLYLLVIRKETTLKLTRRATP